MEDLLKRDLDNLREYTSTPEETIEELERAAYGGTSTVTANRITRGVMVEGVYRYAYLSGVQEVIDFVSDASIHPGGRLEGVPEWYSRLPPEDQDNVKRVAAEAADAAIFGVLCMFDNVRPVVDGFVEQLFIGIRSRDDPEVARELEDGEELHDIFRDIVDSQGS